MKTGIALCASLLAAVLTSSVYAAPVNLLTNGSFDKLDTAKVASTGFIAITTSTNKTALPGWTILGPVDLVSTRLWEAPAEASYSIDLVGTPGSGGIQQVVHETNAETEYQLSFDLSANPAASQWKEHNDTKYLKVDILGGEGEVIATRTYSLTAGTRTYQDMQWAPDSTFAGEGGNFTFTGTGGDITVRFTALAPTPMPTGAKTTTLYCGPVIGNASLIALGGGEPSTPEPASLGILGVGASALILKKRRGR
jgi:hypothetical protein